MRTLIVAFLLCAAVHVSVPCALSREFGGDDPGPIEKEIKSEYSHIRIRRKANVRTLIFVRDSGEEAMESQVDLAKPYELRFPYLRHMFLSYAFLPKQEKVLIVGLGGGSMVHFLKHYDPDLDVDVVEIDPVVVRIANEYFGVRGKEQAKQNEKVEQKLNIITADAVDYLTKSLSENSKPLTPSASPPRGEGSIRIGSKTEAQYDVIYLDAFLKPAETTDQTGVPLNLRSHDFYKDVQKKLKPDGLVVFNLNPHRHVANDLKTIRDAFPQMYVFNLPSNQGRVVVASAAKQRMSMSDLANSAKLIDRRFAASFSFQDMVRSLQR